MARCWKKAILVLSSSVLVPEVGDADLDLGRKKDGTVMVVLEVMAVPEVLGRVSEVLVAKGSNVPCGCGVGWLLTGAIMAFEALPKFWIPASRIDASEALEESIALLAWSESL